GEREGGGVVPAELAVRPDGLRAERFDDRPPGRLAGGHDLARLHVGVHEPASQRDELPAHGGLPGRDATCKADEKERARRHGSSPLPSARDQSGRRNSPRATVTAAPPTSTVSIRSAVPSTRA